MTEAKLIVIKIGSALLTNNGKGLQYTKIHTWISQIAQLKLQGYQIILVSSGAIAEGMARLNWQQRPHEIYKQQAAAAVGQAGLIQAYQSCATEFNLTTAQILLTHTDIANRQHYLNSNSAIKTLLNLGVLPIVNENDTIAADEIRFGDNDSLAGLVVGLMDADSLIILTDQDGMFDKNPRQFTNAKLLTTAQANDKKLDAMASSIGGWLGTGGMKTKLLAARLAAKSGANTIIANGNLDNVLTKILAGVAVGTLLTASEKPLKAKSRWLLGQTTKGELVLDDGAITALNSGNSLLPIGVIKVNNLFSRGDLVACCDYNGVEIARGLVNYNSQDCHKILGVATHKIEQILGFIDEHELIHRDNMVVVKTS